MSKSPEKSKSPTKSPEKDSSAAGWLTPIKRIFSGEEDYDPYQHREKHNLMNYCETVMQIIKAAVGGGALALPQAYAYAGFIWSIVGTFLIAIICTYCLIILIRLQYVLCKKKKVPNMTYADSIILSFEQGPKCLSRCKYIAANCADLFLIVYQLGICCVYIVFLGVNTQTVLKQYFPHMTTRLYMVIYLLPLFIVNSIPSVKALAKLSVAGNIVQVICLLMICYYAVTATKISPGIDLHGDIAKYPLYFGTVMFSMAPVGVVMVIEKNMKRPETFGKPLGPMNVGAACITATYQIFGILGVLYCGSKCADSITLNMPEGTVYTNVVIYGYVLSILLSYALQCSVPVDIIWNNYLKPWRIEKQSPKLCIWEYGLRWFLCIISFTLAIAVPYLGLFISLFGAFCLTILGIIFPAVMDICMNKGNYGPANIYLIRNIFIILFGILGCASGTYASIGAIVHAFQTRAVE